MLYIEYRYKLDKIAAKLKKAKLADEQIALMRKFILQFWESEKAKDRDFCSVPGAYNDHHYFISLGNIDKVENNSGIVTIFREDKEPVYTKFPFEQLSLFLLQYQMARLGKDLMVRVESVDTWDKKEGGLVYLHSGESIALTKKEFEIFEADMKNWVIVGLRDGDDETEEEE